MSRGLIGRACVLALVFLSAGIASAQTMYPADIEFDHEELYSTLRVEALGQGYDGSSPQQEYSGLSIDEENDTGDAIDESDSHTITHSGLSATSHISVLAESQANLSYAFGNYFPLVKTYASQAVYAEANTPPYGPFIRAIMTSKAWARNSHKFSFAGQSGPNYEKQLEVKVDCVVHIRDRDDTDIGIVNPTASVNVNGFTLKATVGTDSAGDYIRVWRSDTGTYVKYHQREKILHVEKTFRRWNNEDFTFNTWANKPGNNGSAVADHASTDTEDESFADCMSEAKIVMLSTEWVGGTYDLP